MKIRLKFYTHLIHVYVYYARSVIPYIGSNRHYETPAEWRGVLLFICSLQYIIDHSLPLIKTKSILETLNI